MRMTMRLVALLLVSLGFAVGTLSPTHPAEAGRPRKVDNEPYPAEFRAKVRTAIRRGIEYIKEQQMRNGGYLGESHSFEEAAAVMWVLRRAGVELNGPEADYQFRILRERDPEEISTASLLVLALCTEPLPEGDPFSLEEDARESRAAPALSDDDLALVKKTVELLLKAQVMEDRHPGRILPVERRRHDSKGGWGRGLEGDRMRTHATVPSTYLALLALEAASRRGIEVPAERFLAALELLLRWQAPKGRKTTLKMNEVHGDKRLEWSVKAHARGFGWVGTMSDEPSGYETAAGAVGLVICKDALQGHPSFTGDFAKKTDEAIYDALVWIQKNYTIKENPDRHRGEVDTAALYHHHWLQSLARLGIHLRLRFLKKHDWYREGAEALIQEQDEDGSWAAIWWSNCYALLFLQRASLRSIVPVITPSER